MSPASWRCEPSPLGREGSRLVTCELGADRRFAWSFEGDEVTDPRTARAKLLWMAEVIAPFVQAAEAAPGLAVRAAGDGWPPRGPGA